MAAYERHQYSGTVPTTATLNGSLTNSGTAITLSSGTGFPDGSVGNFCITIDQGTASEEKVLCASRAGAVITVAASGRGYDGTTATSHASGAGVLHTISARDMDEANQAVSNTLGKITTAGDVLYAATATSLARLGIGSAGQLLAVVSGLPGWQTGLTLTGDITAAPGSSATTLKNTGPGASGPIGDATHVAAVTIDAQGRVTALTSVAITFPAGVVTAENDATVATSQTTTSTSYADLATAGPAATLTVGASGKVLVSLSAMANHSAANTALWMGFAISGASTVAASDNQALVIVQAGSTIPVASLGITIPISGLAAGSTTFTAKYRVGAGTGTWANRTISVLAL